jgi:uncharacterized protein (TIGR02598 family)
MRSWRCRIAAFSLVEVTLALGVAGFCLIAVFGLLPVGVQTNQRATSQTAAASIIANVVADLRATPNPPRINTSVQYEITFGTTKPPLYFDGAGQFSTSLGPNSRYQLNVTFPWTSGNTYGANLKVTWPAAATAANASGSVETFAAFDRN